MPNIAGDWDNLPDKEEDKMQTQNNVERYMNTRGGGGRFNEIQILTIADMEIRANLRKEKAELEVRLNELNKILK